MSLNYEISYTCKFCNTVYEENKPSMCKVCGHNEWNETSRPKKISKEEIKKQSEKYIEIYEKYDTGDPSIKAEVIARAKNSLDLEKQLQAYEIAAALIFVLAMAFVGLGFLLDVMALVWIGIILIWVPGIPLFLKKGKAEEGQKDLDAMKLILNFLKKRAASLKGTQIKFEYAFSYECAVCNSTQTGMVPEPTCSNCGSKVDSKFLYRWNCPLCGYNVEKEKWCPECSMSFFPKGEWICCGRTYDLNGNGTCEVCGKGVDSVKLNLFPSSNNPQ